MKLIRGLCGPALRDLYLRFVQNDETFGSTNFFKPVRDFVKRLNKHFAYVNLESHPIADAKVFLRDAIYEELNMQLANYDGAHTCHVIHPTWKPLRWQRDMESKLTQCRANYIVRKHHIWYRIYSVANVSEFAFLSIANAKPNEANLKTFQANANITNNFLKK